MKVTSALLYDWDCERRLLRQNQDIPFFCQFAREAAGPILVAGCGTGRVAIPVARATREPVAGLDIDLDALDRLARSVKANGGPANLRPFAADMSRFALDARFALTIVPYSAIQMMPAAQMDEAVRSLPPIWRRRAGW